MRVLIVLFTLCALTCGSSILRRHWPKTLFDGRIIDGENADIKEVPYQVALLINGQQNCGGSIISANWALTAAHCVDGTPARSITLRVGSVLWNEGGSLHQVDKNIVHPEYSKIIWSDYDYAVLRVETPFPLGQPGIAAVQLSSQDVVAGTTAIVSGWGQGNYRVSRLQRVNVPVVGRTECQRVYGESSVTPRMMCAGWPEGGKNTCYGDSGGPLVVAGRQVGIVSWASGCAQKGYPTVFGDVANQLEWIKANTDV